MPVKPILLRFALIAGLTLFFVLFFLPVNNQNQRRPASVGGSANADKWSSLVKTDYSNIRTGKTGGPFQVAVESRLTSDGTLISNIRVSVIDDVQNAFYQLHLPKSSRLLVGDESGELGPAPGGHVFPFEFEVMGLNENDRVFFEIFEASQNAKRGSSVSLLKTKKVGSKVRPFSSDGSLKGIHF